MAGHIEMLHPVMDTNPSRLSMATHAQKAPTQHLAGVCGCGSRLLMTKWPMDQRLQPRMIHRAQQLR
jgi:hypothetical protein